MQPVALNVGAGVFAIRIESMLMHQPLPVAINATVS